MAVQEIEQEALQVSLLDKIMEDVDKLSPQYRVRLIQRVAEKFLPSPPAEVQQTAVQRKPGQLEYGKYAGQWEISEEDFKRAEWGPDKVAQLEKELDGE
ncbi:MAG: hypothetical protein KY468_18615 [Armatimonadetes bacterium]|nr:hypothetical protein [Armatimonadota bacterium]